MLQQMLQRHHLIKKRLIHSQLQLVAPGTQSRARSTRCFQRQSRGDTRSHRCGRDWHGDSCGRSRSVAMRSGGMRNYGSGRDAGRNASLLCLCRSGHQKLGLSRARAASSCRHLTNTSRHIRLRRDLRDQKSHLLLSLTPRALEQRRMVLVCQLRSQQLDSTQAKRALQEHLQRQGIAPSHSCSTDPQISLITTHPQNRHRITKQRRIPLCEMQLTLVSLCKQHKNARLTPPIHPRKFVQLSHQPHISKPPSLESPRNQLGTHNTPVR